MTAHTLSGRLHFLGTEISTTFVTSSVRRRAEEGFGSPPETQPPVESIIHTTHTAASCIKYIYSIYREDTNDSKHFLKKVPSVTSVFIRILKEILFVFFKRVCFRLFAINPIPLLYKSILRLCESHIQIIIDRCL